MDKTAFKGTIKIVPEEDRYVGTCLENNVVSQGETIEETMKNLKEAISLYYENEDKSNLMILLEEADNDIEIGNYFTEEEMNRKLDLL